MDSDASFLKVLHFFSSSAKDKGVATLQAQDFGASLGKLAQQLMNLWLGPGVKPTILSHIDHGSTGIDQLQYLW